MVTLAVLAVALATAQQGPAVPPPRFPASVVSTPPAVAVEVGVAPPAVAVETGVAPPPRAVPVGVVPPDSGRAGALRTPEPIAAAPAGGAAPSPGGGSAVAVRTVADTPAVRTRPRAFEYPDGYARRLAIHRVASYTLLPLLGLQYYTGTQLMAKGSNAPDWVIRAHAPLATTAAVVFGVNTVTGVWNLWDARKDPNGRFGRTAHALLMLASDAGFLVAGSMGHKAVQDGATRSLHRTIALSSMGAALVGYAIMLPPFRR